METLAESVVQSEAVNPPVPGALVVFSGDLPVYRQVALTPAERRVLGRGDFGDERVSSTHVALTFTNGRFQVEDLGSKNGTYVDGQRLEGPRTVDPGAVVRLGKAVVLVLCVDLRPYLSSHVTTDEYVIGPTLRDALDRAAQARQGNKHLLVHGESGAGKELVARRYHEAAERRGPFVAVNCANLGREMADAALFGAKKGAYTGLAVDREGYLTAADGGVLFLDEIAELDLEVQPKLLRAVETGEVLRLGDVTPLKVSVRVVTASHEDLRDAVEGKRFRQDLYYRLAQAEVDLPSLRDRPEDVPWLVQVALKAEGLPAHATLIEAVLLRSWPGNVRELMKELRDAASTAKRKPDTAVREDALSPRAGRTASEFAAATGAGDRGADASAPSGSAELTKDRVEAALAANAGRIAATARALGLHRTQLYRVLKRYGLKGADAGEAET